MPSYCCVPTCTNDSTKGYSLFHFPQDRERRVEWLSRISRPSWTPKSHHLVCEAHFDPTMICFFGGRKELCAGALPTLFCNCDPVKPKLLSPSMENFHVFVDHTYSTPAAGRRTPLGGLQVSTTPSTGNLEYKRKPGKENLTPRHRTKRTHLAECSLSRAPLRPQLPAPNPLPSSPTSEEVQKLIDENVRLKEQVSSLLERAKLVNQVVSSDQLVALKKGTHRLVKWSSDSIVEGLSLKFTCGTTGYIQLRKKIPLPSTRTLRRSVQSIDFEPGVLEVVFTTLSSEVPKMRLIDKDCVVVLDEMSITPRLDLDRSTGCYIGNVTIPHGDKSECACKALVFMVNGLARRYKQIVAYHFCGSKDNTDGTAEVLLDILKRCDDVGLNVLGIVCDMGNRAVLKKLGFDFTRAGMMYKIQNPVHAGKTLYVVPDFVHVFKSTKEMLCKTDRITLPDNVVTHYQLPSSIVNMTLVDWLEAAERDSILKFAPKLKEGDIHPNHFKKMKVSSSTNVISHQVGGALVHLGANCGNPDMITTGWFIKKLRRWFTIVTSRNQGKALSVKNMQAYDEAIEVINLICEIFEKSDFGDSWKVTRTHVIMSCKALLEIHRDQLSRGYQYVCCGNVTQDSIENVFSCVRIQRPKPSALDFKFRLKQFVFGRIAVKVANSSYTHDDAPSLISLLRTGKASRHPHPTTSDGVTDSHLSFAVLENCVDLSDEEKGILYRMSGYVLLKMKKRIKCTKCYGSLVYPANEPPHPHAGFTIETDIKSEA